jgi:hypothetical protein
MKYFPLRDPISDAMMLPAGRKMEKIIVALYIDGELAGHVSLPITELAPFLGLISDPVPIAEHDTLFDAAGAEWHGDYEKPHVVSEDGTLVNVHDIP